MAQIKGFDISVHQGQVNWDAIQAAYDRGDIGFVILRAGYGGGGGDGQFARNRDEARRRGIPRQFYFFAYPGRSGGAAQADEFASRVGALQPGESVSLDMEDEPSYGRNLVASDVQWALDFLRRAESRFGVKPLIYLNSYLKGKFNWKPVVDGDYGLWIANYGPNNGQPSGAGPDPAPWKFWALWQYTSRANVAGISPLDMNIFSGDKTAFLKYGKQGGSAPAPTPAPQPKPTPAPAPAPAAKTYTVKAGDTLSGIASKFGTTYKELARINGIADPNKIYAGQVLKLSGAQGSGASFYTVRSGDTLSGIAKANGTSWQTLQAINNIKDPNRIYPGQQIRLR